jgi:hypothetical protein
MVDIAPANIIIQVTPMRVALFFKSEGFMKAALSFETSGVNNPAFQCNTTIDLNPEYKGNENLRSHIKIGTPHFENAL